MSESRYVFDTADEAERLRLDAQTTLWDEFTFSQLAAVGVREGWRCLEVGGGTGSVAAWLRDRVGADGHLVVTDLETRWLKPLEHVGVEVRTHDVVDDPIETSCYDLIHARLVLMHLRQRDAVLDKLVAALRPGGWLVVHDYDLHTMTTAHPSYPTWSKLIEALGKTLAVTGGDPRFGTKLPGALVAAGLDSVDAQGLVLPLPAQELAPAVLNVIERLREPVLEAGLATTDEIDAVVDELTSPTSERWLCTPVLVSARGRRAHQIRA